MNNTDMNCNNREKLPKHIIFLCYISYAILIAFGYLRDFLRIIGFEKNMSAIETNRKGFVPIYKGFDNFFTRNLYRRGCDVCNRPVCSIPGALITLIDRESDDNWNFKYCGTKSKVINTGSYNYLGFTENTDSINAQVLDTIENYGMVQCTTGRELGNIKLIRDLEAKVAKFLGVDSSIVFGMGFATNSTNISVLVGKGCLVLNDELNHSSIALGCKLSGATIKTFRHNDMKHLEQIIRESIIFGEQRTHRRWKKVLIIVEGIYSMEGTVVYLPELIHIKRKYKCYVYLDEAHSIGAMGQNGRGICDYYGCDSNDIDVLMGTFTKSFGSAGGYIAGKRHIVEHIRSESYASSYANPMSPVIAQKICGVLSVLMGEKGTNEGQKRIRRLARNTRYFRRKLSQMGFIIYGNMDSPIVPIIVCFPSKLIAMIRMSYEKGIGLIGATFPATSLTTCRVRLCMSASHTKEILDKTLEVLNELGDKLEIKYSSRPTNKRKIIY